MRRLGVVVVAVALAAPGRAGAGAGTWTTAGPSFPVLAVAVDPTAPATVYAGSKAAGVFRSTDGGASWAAFGLGPNSIPAVAVAATSPPTAYAGTNGAGIYTDSTADPAWTLAGLAYASVQALAIVQSAPATVFAGTNVSGMMRTTDGGLSWFKSGLGTTSVVAAATDPAAAGTVYAATATGVFKSTDGGATWLTANVGLAGVTVRAFAVDPVNTGTVYAATGAGVFKTTNGGAGWSPAIAGLTNLSVTALAITTFGRPTVYAGTTGGGVFVSNDAGASWSALNPGLANLSVNALAVAPTTPPTVFAGTALGVFAYTEPVVCATPAGLANNTAADPKPCAGTGLTVAWSPPSDWGDSGAGTRTFDVLRDGIPIATGLAAADTAFADVTATPYVEYTYSVRADNGCGLSATTVGAPASDTTARPAIVTQPSGVTIWAGHATALRVAASGASSFQWYVGASGDVSHPIAGATSWQYVTPVLTTSTSFWVQAWNACGSTASDAATVTLKWRRLRRHLGTAP